MLINIILLVDMLFVMDFLPFVDHLLMGVNLSHENAKYNFLYYFIL